MRRTSWLAVVTVGAAVALAACSSSGSPAPHHSSKTAQPTSSSDPSSRTPSASRGPLPGGVPYLHLAQTENAAEVASVGAINAAGQTKNVSAAAAAVRKFRTQEYHFDLAVRKLALASTAKPDETTLLSAENTLSSAADTLAKDTTVASFGKDYGAFTAAARKVHVDVVTLAADLDVATDHPTTHLAPTGLPTVVAPHDHVFGSESSTYGFDRYAKGGYLLTVTGHSGIALEADRHRLPLADTTVSATAHQTGSGTTYLTCRSTGSGTSTGRQYTFGVGTNGVWEIQYINADTQQVKNLATDTSTAIHSGKNVTNTIRADCVGNYLTLFVNGTPIYQVYDSTLPRGSVGVGVTTPSGPTQTVVTDFRAAGKP